MSATNLLAAVNAVTKYIVNEPVGEADVVLVGVRSIDLAERYYVVEGVRRAFHRVYVVNVKNDRVVEVLCGHGMDEAALIEEHIAAIRRRIIASWERA